MNDKIFDSLMTYSRDQVLKAISILLWFSLLLVSFNKFICKLNYQTITSGEKLCNYFISGEYVILISWLMCIVFVYALLKYLIVNIIPASAYGLKFFLEHLIPKDYRVSLLNIYYKKVLNVGTDHFKKAVEYELKGNPSTTTANKNKIDLLVGIILKFQIILITVIGQFRGVELIITSATLLITFALILFLLCTLVAFNARRLVKGLLSDILRNQS